MPQCPYTFEAWTFLLWNKEFFRQFSAPKLAVAGGLNQGSLTEGEDSVPLASLY